MERITEFEVKSNYLLSDHFPIIWAIPTSIPIHKKTKKKKSNKLNWSNDKQTDVINSVRLKLDALTEVVSNTDYDTSTATLKFTTLLHETVRQHMSRPDGEWSGGQGDAG